MFSGFMVDAWIVATVVAVVAGSIGFFVVLRGSAFMAHAVPQSGFAGAAAATLVGINTLAGLGLFAVASAVSMGLLSRRGRSDVVTALVLVMTLGLGALLLSFTNQYDNQVFSLLFGEILGVGSNDVPPTLILGALSLIALTILYRPLLLTSVLPESARAKGVRGDAVALCFLVVVALATTMSVPVVGALLMFSLMVGPPAAASSLARRPGMALTLSVVLALATVWASIAASYESNWPIGFYVGVFGAAVYLASRAWSAGRLRRARTEQCYPNSVRQWEHSP